MCSHNIEEAYRAVCNSLPEYSEKRRMDGVAIENVEVVPATLGGELFYM